MINFCTFRINVGFINNLEVTLYSKMASKVSLRSKNIGVVFTGYTFRMRFDLCTSVLI